ncbi:MAG TPA: response regulator [Flavisolibacter sp.]|jgi:DNA-binding NarL/FixJ family response regulator
MALKPLSIQSVLLADDDEDDRFVFRDVIYEINPKIHMEIVSGGIQLMKLLEHFAPDLLFLDLEMPFKNGLECLIEIRENEKLKDLPIVVFSSTSRPANIQTAYEMGAHLFLIKEASFDQYTAALKTILQLNWKNPEKIKEQYCINGRFATFS